jgi:homoserine O-acetyltransferase
MPAEKGVYFPPEDEKCEVSWVPNAGLRVIPGVWGHFASSGLIPRTPPTLTAPLTELLDE